MLSFSLWHNWALSTNCRGQRHAIDVDDLAPPARIIHGTPVSLTVGTRIGVYEVIAQIGAAPSTSCTVTK